MYKDAPHEGFTWFRYFRSPMVGFVMALIAYLVAPPDLSRPGQMVLFFGLVYVLERGAIEFWKTFLRDEDQSKYFIPMQFAVFGRVIQGKSQRLLIGFPLAIIIVLVFLGVHWVSRRRDARRRRVHPRRCSRREHQRLDFGVSRRLEGRADRRLRDAEVLPEPGGRRAVRRAARAVHDELPAGRLRGARLHDRHARNYKTFFFPSKPRGKFAGKPILYPEMLRAAEGVCRGLCVHLGADDHRLRAGVLAAARRRPVALAAARERRRTRSRVVRRRLASTRRPRDARGRRRGGRRRRSSRRRQYRWLVGYGLYAIPAHLLISFLPNEPALLYVAKLYPPLLVATVGTARVRGDGRARLLVDRLVREPRAGPVEARHVARLIRFAQPHLHEGAVPVDRGSALAPGAVLSGEDPGHRERLLPRRGSSPPWSSGRWPRFYLLAIGGREVQAPNSWLLGAAIVLEVLDRRRDLAHAPVGRTERRTGSASECA